MCDIMGSLKSDKADLLELSESMTISEKSYSIS